ncbi:MAG TPA: hypothetical protein PKZ53_20900, partial [Acidobacteriota bacterium]|nr:hypothetical protein [Acidobacteriota bacterium]
ESAVSGQWFAKFISLNDLIVFHPAMSVQTSMAGFSLVLIVSISQNDSIFPGKLSYSQPQ